MAASNVSRTFGLGSGVQEKRDSLYLLRTLSQILPTDSFGYLGGSPSEESLANFTYYGT